MAFMASPANEVQLEKAIGEIWEAARKNGLDPFPTHFEIVPATILYEFGAYLLPGRFSHWTHGKAFHRLKSSYDYGLSKIYELVFNSDPAVALLLETNTLTENKFVVAHVLAHVDFFKHNLYFAPTSRQMIETASVDAERIRKYEFENGALEVEKYLDAVLALEEHVDPHPRRGKGREGTSSAPRAGDRRPQTPYDDLFERPRAEAKPEPQRPRKFPEEPEKDLLLFLMQHAPELKDWQRDVIAIVRQEMLYFVPQMQTKIMNEGWASFWHSRIMRELPLTDDEFTDFARLHSSVMTPSRMRINPYYVGYKVFEDIEKRFGRGRIFEVRETDCDQSFLRNYLTEELVKDLDLYIYELEGEEWKIKEKNWEKVRDALVDSLTNFGYPYLTVEDGDYHKNRELYLKHNFDGRELDIPYAEKALIHLGSIWRRPVHLETNLNGRKVVFTCESGSVLKTVY